MGYQDGHLITRDGSRLFYQVVGEGPSIVACNGIGVSTFFWRYLQAHLKRNFRFIVWDYRGHGRSSLPADRHRVSVEILADDLSQLVEHLCVEAPILCGHSMGVQVILEFYRHHPEHARALILVLGSYGRPLDTFMNSRVSRPIFDQLVKLSRWWPRGIAALVRIMTDPVYAARGAQLIGMVDRFYCPAEDLRQYLEHIGSLDTEFLLRLAVSMADHSAESVLQHINVPTMIVAGERDLFTPVHLSYEMQRRIPGAELLMLRGGSHAALIEQPEVMIQGLEQFFVAHALDEESSNPSSGASNRAMGGV